MSKQNNKPEWLIKAEQERDKFNDTKYAKVSDTQLDKINNTILNFKLNDSIEQSKRSKIAREKDPKAASRGGKTRAKSFNKEYQRKAAKNNSYENKIKAAKLGAQKNKEIKAELKIKNLNKLYNLLNDTFTTKDLDNLFEIFNHSNSQVLRRWVNEDNRYELIGYDLNWHKGGAKPKLYKKVKQN